jgi:lipopolysaccharide/colanic/teichoic acid biosynthesis glycosyltransferase
MVDKKINGLLKRSSDVVMSIFGLVASFPILSLIAICIKISMPRGPVLFKQIRIGKNGKRFVMFKFRSMRVSRTESNISVYDSFRITKLGHYLRRYKLDELPELFNVLIGDMSFVGPRPDVPGYADKLKNEEKLILLLRPGITSPASLKYANEEEQLALSDDPQKYNDEVIFPDKVRINLEYYHNHSLLGDLKIIVNTILRNYE